MLSAMQLSTHGSKGMQNCKSETCENRGNPVSGSSSFSFTNTYCTISTFSLARESKLCQLDQETVYVRVRARMDRVRTPAPCWSWDGYSNYSTPVKLSHFLAERHDYYLADLETIS
jgi:hypothetical protein